MSTHSMFLVVNQFAICIRHEWRDCSPYSPPATVFLLLFLIFEALLFAVFTLIMLITQLNAIWNDETVITMKIVVYTRTTDNKLNMVFHLELYLREILMIV